MLISVDGNQKSGKIRENLLRLVVYPIFLQGVLYIPRWLFGISSINSMMGI